MVPLLALSVQDQIEKLGAYAGFAAVIGLAVLALLYFSQAREVKRLREWAGRAPERARELEERVAQQAQAARVPAPAAAPAQRRVVAQPISRPVQPGQAAAAAAPARAAAPATAAAAGAVAATAATAATAGDEAEDEERDEATGNGQKPVDPQATQLHQTIAPGSSPVTSGDSAGDDDDDDAVATGDEDRPAAATPAAAAAPLRRPATASASPSSEVPAAPVAASGPSAPAAPPPPQRPTYAQPRSAGRPVVPPREPRSSRRTWILAGLGVLLLAAATVGGVLALTGGSDTPPPPNKPVVAKNGSSGSSSSSTSGSGGAVQRGDVTVAVLNGTTITGLAADTRDRIVASGFKQGAIDTNLDQTLTQTTVYYADGFKKAAQDVADLLKVKNVAPLPSQTAAIARNPDVVVVVGLDRTQ